MRSAIYLSVLLIAPTAWAHPGGRDACGGHTVTKRVEYPPQANGEPTVPSEPGEQHFHFSAVQVKEEVLPTLWAYRRTHPDVKDFGTFVVNGRAYDIWEYTRQGEAILRCQGDAEVLHTGIARVLE